MPTDLGDYNPDSEDEDEGTVEPSAHYFQVTLGWNLNLVQTVIITLISGIVTGLLIDRFW